MKNLNKKQGISLIVLVITIIVIVVLATAVILSIANNNPIEIAKEAKNANNQKVLEEAANLEYASMYADKKIKGEEIDTAAMTEAIRTTLETQGFSKDEVEKITVTENGLEIKEATFIKKGELALGNEVTALNGEEFYIIGGDTVGTEISDSTQNIILLSKYNIELTALKQDTSGSYNVCSFSSTNYWADVEGITYPADLNDEEKYPRGSAISLITTAKEYGASLGVTGRLMTYKEACALRKDYSLILYGNTQGNLRYWLGTAARDDQVDCVYGDESRIDTCYFGFNHYVYYGCRPVITVSKSLIK